MQKKNLHISTTILIAFLTGFFLFNHIPSIAQEENVNVPGINEELIEKNNDVEVLSPSYGDVFPFGEDILISWRNKNPQKEYIYVVYYYYLEGQFHMGYSGRSTEETNIFIQPFQESVIALQVYYYDKEFFYTEQKKEHMYATDILVLGIGMDIPEFWYKRFYKEKPLPVENPITEPPAEPITIPKEEAKEKNQKIQEIIKPTKKPTKKVIENQEETFAWNLTTQKDVKGSQVRRTECRYKYIQTYGSVRKIQCDIPSLENLSAQVIDRGAYKEILVRGDIYRDIFVDIDIYTCKNNILQLLLGKECKEKYLRTENLHIYPNIHMNISLNGKKYSPLSFGISQNNFFLTTQISKTENVESIDLEYITAFRISQFNIFENKKEKYTISVKEEVQERTKPFIFPFNHIVGVSQWHGYTDYQKPHTGIDFSVAKKDTLAVGDGLVVGKGWDSFYGKCLSGGNYLTVKHDNGMHSVYFHLEDSFTDVGKRVKEGDIVAKTGNSGYWNCQPLAYHLHFELRENAQQSSHVNPVEYIEQDWDKILTVGYKQYPGRLSGDNPHPGR